MQKTKTKSMREIGLELLGEFEIREITVFPGHESEPCFAGHLHRNGEQVAHFSDSSTGGEMDISFFDIQAAALWGEALGDIGAFDFEGEEFEATNWAGVQHIIERDGGTIRYTKLAGVVV